MAPQYCCGELLVLISKGLFTLSESGVALARVCRPSESKSDVAFLIAYGPIEAKVNCFRSV